MPKPLGPYNTAQLLDASYLNVKIQDSAASEFHAGLNGDPRTEAIHRLRKEFYQYYLDKLNRNTDTTKERKANA